MRYSELDPAIQLSPKEVARWLGKKEKTLANWRCKGKGPPFVKDPGNGRIGYVVGDVRQYQNDNKHKSTSDTKHIDIPKKTQYEITRGADTNAIGWRLI